jgi:hypothetical protein
MAILAGELTIPKLLPSFRFCLAIEGREKDSGCQINKRLDTEKKTDYLFHLLLNTEPLLTELQINRRKVQGEVLRQKIIKCPINNALRLMVVGAAGQVH